MRRQCKHVSLVQDYERGGNRSAADEVLRQGMEGVSYVV